MSCVFYGENTLDKSLFRRKSSKNTHWTAATPTICIILMMDTQELISTAPIFRG